jgi:hypothetical protein
MTAWREGFGRVLRSPGIVAGVYAMTLFISLPLALVLRQMIATHLGASLEADAAAVGVNYDWMQEFADQAAGVGVTFKPTIIGFGAVLDNLGAFVDRTARPLVIIAAALVYIGLWTFAAGGILTRYARNRPIRAHGFFGAGGVFFLRILRLGVIQWIVYGTLFGTVHRMLFDTLLPRLTREMTVERNAFLLRAFLYLVLLLLVAAANIVFDYAKVRAVVEDRRSALGAVAAAVRFIRRNAGAAAAVYMINVVLFAAVVGVYALVAPGAGGGGAAMWIGLAIGQLYVLARLVVKLTFWASETALFQSRLAHAGYVAAPEPAWPESPAAEAIRQP